MAVESRVDKYGGHNTGLVYNKEYWPASSEPSTFYSITLTLMNPDKLGR